MKIEKDLIDQSVTSCDSKNSKNSRKKLTPVMSNVFEKDKKNRGKSFTTVRYQIRQNSQILSNTLTPVL